jgi:hypothetical protein
MTDTINYVRLDADNLAELREAAKQALQLLGSHPAPNGGAIYEALNRGLSVTSGAFVDELADDEDTGPDPDEGLEIQRTLVVSTAHLPVAHREWLDAQNRSSTKLPTLSLPTARNPAPHDFHVCLIVDAIGFYGWRICIAEAVNRFATLVTEDDPLLALLRFAEAHRCDWLAIDRDGHVVAGLPTFED